MNWILGLGATLLGVYLFLLAMSVIVTLSRLVRLQFWAISGETVIRDEAGPETVVLDSARAILEQEGFVYRRTSLVGSLIASPAYPASLCDFYYHAALDVRAEVVTAATPSPQRLCDILLSNGFEDGSALMTVNGIAHHIFTFPSNITIVDPYAQTMQLQMAAHLARRDTIDLARIAPAAAPDFNAQLAAGMWPAMVSEGRAYKLGERQGKTVYALSLAAALKATWRMRAGAIQRKLMALGEAPLDEAAQASSPA